MPTVPSNDPAELEKQRRRYEELKRKQNGKCLCAWHTPTSQTYKLEQGALFSGTTEEDFGLCLYVPEPEGLMPAEVAVKGKGRVGKQR